MAGVSGNIVLNGVTDKDLELIWTYKAKHERTLSFAPQQMQPASTPQGPVYNNVIFNYGDRAGLNLITEIVNELHKKEQEAKTASR